MGNRFLLDTKHQQITDRKIIFSIFFHFYIIDLNEFIDNKPERKEFLHLSKWCYKVRVRLIENERKG